ncbi:hypothetical protein CAPTEDRAFT_189441 [Capitella teleta]|uniref:Uncharacterized protein n=1 Tax=Capitella teleta TaxID=283909 RepID=R7V9Q9_CAPTE|nr:hypothetical protein CAPTEDRAFT_189441 [Capitella teleta]|eukprot:ELU15578.1 hypothetical protein CAPTEDRAFT_189441 [Capitella teleta]
MHKLLVSWGFASFMPALACSLADFARMMTAAGDITLSLPIQGEVKVTFQEASDKHQDVKTHTASDAPNCNGETVATSLAKFGTEFFAIVDAVVDCLLKDTECAPKKIILKMEQYNPQMTKEQLPLQ